MGIELEKRQMLFADIRVLIMESNGKLQELADEFGRTRVRMSLRVNIRKSKMMVKSRKDGKDSLKVMLNGEGHLKGVKLDWRLFL